MHNQTKENDQRSGFWTSRTALAFLIFGAVAGFYLLTEHRAHLFGALPYLLLLACPVMHLFMHHNHGGHESSPNESEKVVTKKPGDQS